MISKLWKATMTFVVFVVLLFLTSWRSMPETLSAVLIIITLTYGISVFLSAQIPGYRRFGIGYLLFVGLTYLLAGIVGLVPHWDLIAAVTWHFLISPGPSLAVVRGLTHPSSFNVYKLDYWIFPESDLGLTSLSITAVVAGTTAIAAAFWMGKNRRVGSNAWLVFVVLSILEALGYAVAEFAKWGVPQYKGLNDPTQTIVALCWAGSYLAAYLMARTGADFTKGAFSH